MKKIIFAVIFSLFLCNTIYAENEITARISYDINTRKVKIEGSIKDSYCGQVQIMIMSSQMSPDIVTASDFGNQKVLADSFRISEDDSFLKEIYLPNTFESGKYTVYVFYKNLRTSNEFINIADKVAADMVIEKLNDAGISEFQTVISDNLDALGLNEEEFQANKSVISDILYKTRPQEGYTIENFFNQYTVGLALSLLKSGNESLGNIIKMYGNYLQIDYYNDFSLYSQEVKFELEALIKNQNYAAGIFRDFYMNNLLLSRVRKSASYEELKELILNDYSSMGINLSAYNSIGNSYYQDNVFRELYKKIVNELSDVKKYFDIEVSNQMQIKGGNHSNIPSNNGSGGLSGGGGGRIITGPAENVTPAPEEIKTFFDMENHWAREAVNNLSSSNIINGYDDGSFLPDTNVTRAEFAKMISTFMKLTGVDKNVFSDVSDNAWYAPYVNAMANANIIKGFENKFSPNNLITREDAAVIIYRVLKYYVKISEETFTFEDLENISDYAKESVQSLAANNLIKGYDNVFMPKGLLTRAEAAIMIYNISKHLGE